jgi:hypothetical protein
MLAERNVAHATLYNLLHWCNLASQQARRGHPALPMLISALRQAYSVEPIPVGIVTEFGQRYTSLADSTIIAWPTLCDIVTQRAQRLLALHHLLSSSNIMQSAVTQTWVPRHHDDVTSDITLAVALEYATLDDLDTLRSLDPDVKR